MHEDSADIVISSDNWVTAKDCSLKSHSSTNRRRRLVVLEGSWSAAKTMHSKIVSHRQAENLPSIDCALLVGLVGQYWRFHNMGNSAVSTIEAIAFAAKAAGLCNSDHETLLLLFRLQQLRVFESMEENGKAPRAIKVNGYGLGEWKNE